MKDAIGIAQEAIPAGDRVEIDAETGKLRRARPLIDGKQLPPGVTMDDWMRLHFAPGFYHWLNAVHGCQTGVYWRLTDKVGWCGV